MQVSTSQTATCLLHMIAFGQLERVCVADAGEADAGLFQQDSRFVIAALSIHPAFISTSDAPAFSHSQCLSNLLIQSLAAFPIFLLSVSFDSSLCFPPYHFISYSLSFSSSVRVWTH